MIGLEIKSSLYLLRTEYNRNSSNGPVHQSCEHLTDK